MNIIQDEIEKILQCFANGKHLESLKKAKEIFFAKTGKIDEDSYEYESRMSSFNDWYLFQYQFSSNHTVVQEYFANNFVDETLATAISNATYSLYLFHKINFRKQIIIKDILHGTKHVLSKDNGNLSLVEDDIFVGRMIEYQEQSFLLNGLCTLPKEVLPILKKECRKIRKSKNIEEEDFLLNLERLKTKSMQYKHIEPSQIFTF